MGMSSSSSSACNSSSTCTSIDICSSKPTLCPVPSTTLSLFARLNKTVYFIITIKTYQNLQQNLRKGISILTLIVY